MSLFHFFTTIIIIVLLSIIVTGVQYQPTNHCYQCASIELQREWSLTGLIKLDNMQFSDCEWNPQSMNSANGVICAGPCFTYIFQDPNQSPTNKKLYVRGCHHQLTGIRVHIDMQGGGRNNIRCDYDKSFQRVDRNGNTVRTRALMEYCNGQMCNQRSLFPDEYNGGRCNTKSFNNNRLTRILQ